MSTVQEYFRKLSTQQLRDILHDHMTGLGDYPMEVILDICSVLAGRSSREQDARKALQNFYENYCPEDKKDL